VASVEDAQGKKELSLRARLNIDHDTWLAARAGGRGYDDIVRHHDELKRGIMAHSSPVYVTLGEQWQMRSPETMQYMLTLLHGGLDYVRERSPQYPPGQVSHHHLEADHLAYLERPFIEAIQAVRSRMA
jgi:hypothetical protein